MLCTRNKSPSIYLIKVDLKRGSKFLLKVGDFTGFDTELRRKQSKIMRTAVETYCLICNDLLNTFKENMTEE
jgi:hypothetical protein